MPSSGHNADNTSRSSSASVASSSAISAVTGATGVDERAALKQRSSDLRLREWGSLRACAAECGDSDAMPRGRDQIVAERHDFALVAACSAPAMDTTICKSVGRTRRFAWQIGRFVECRFRLLAGYRRRVHDAVLFMFPLMPS
jgi:hypothetical protein